MRLAYRARSVGIAQSAKGSRSAKSAGRTVDTRRPPRSRPRRRAIRRPLEVVEVALRRLVQVPEQNLLVVQRKAPDRCVGLEHRLGRLERVAVLQRVLLERHDGELLGEALAP